MRWSRNNLAKVFLHPGELYFANEPAHIITVLGSCISVTMFHPDSQTAAMSHSILPGGDCQKSVSGNWRHTNCAIISMIRLFDRLRIRRNEIETKIFGGADIFVSSESTFHFYSIGRQNTEIAFDLLKSEGFYVLAADTGGRFGRKIIFNTGTGEVRLKRLSSQENSILQGA